VEPVVRSLVRISKDDSQFTWLSNLLILGVPDEGHVRNASCALNLISTFSLQYRNVVIVDSKIRIFFSATLGIRIFFFEKNINPLKLNGRSLINLKDAFALFVILSMWYVVIVDCQILLMYLFLYSIDMKIYLYLISIQMNERWTGLQRRNLIKVCERGSH
jgi:hypothetical protein